MKTIMTCNMTTVFIVTLIISCGLVNAEDKLNRTSGKFYPVDANEIPKILNMISDAAQDNYRGISTWEGEVESELDYIYEGEAAERIFKSSTHNIGETPRAIINSAETIVKFSLDAEKSCIYVHNYSDKPIKYMDLDTGRDLGAKGIPGEAKSILTKEYYIKYRADRMRNGVVTSRKAIKKNIKDCPECQTSPVFDPRESFNAGEPVWKTLQHVSEHIKKKGEWKIDGHNFRAEENNDGNVVHYRIIIPGKISDAIVFSTMVFSGDKGFNITLFEATDINGRIFQKATWDYDLIQGIYLPKETTNENYMGIMAGLVSAKKCFSKIHE